MSEEKIIHEQGDLSISTENIFPIIKKWLYSDHDIFLRELVSNASDAINKLNHFTGLGEFKGHAEANKIDIKVNKEAKTITITDTGIGMTAEEVKKYINQIAFSGAEEFVNKYKSGDKKSQIIGHFGLGFYSSYMVASLVEIHTLSYLEGAQAVHWTCDGSTKYSLESSDKSTIGSEVILHISDESADYLEASKLTEILEKYCKYYPVPVFFEDKQINETHPIWAKSPTELTEENYKEFYRKEFPMKEEPLFWIHLNVDFPFNLNGVLYFPKLKQDLEVNKNDISLYCNQVFVSNQINDILPEYLQLLHGVIDSPDIPLNVSRSFLQKDANVKKIATHITKKIADKLKALFNTERENYEKYWSDIHPFIKYGMIRDDDFYDKVNTIGLFKIIDNDKYVTLNEYKEYVIANQIDKNNKCVILYSNDEKQQGTYIKMAQDKGYAVVQLDHVIDAHYITHLERKLSDFKFVRVDSNTADRLIEKETAVTELDKEVVESYEKLFREALNNEKLTVKVEEMSQANISAIITLSEESRRMKEMMIMMNPNGANLDDLFGGSTLILNHNNTIIKRINSLWDLDKTKATLLAEHVYDLASLAQKPLEKERLSNFINRSNELLEKIG